MKCNLVKTGVDGHGGKHWYQCLTCGAEDWFAYYGLPENKQQLKDCKLKDNK